MQDKDNGPQQEKKMLSEQENLSEIWQELLGKRQQGMPKGGEKQISSVDNADDTVIPTLDSDPWSALIQAKGIEIVDLHKTKLRISDQEVEQMLEMMQERPAQDDESSSSS